MTDPTGKRLFFQVLHVGRTLKEAVPDSHNRFAFLCGMFHAFKFNREDFTIADSMRDIWKQQRGEL